MALATALFPTHITLIDHLLPATKSHHKTLIHNISLIIGFSLLISLCAQIAFLLPFSPVPITLQTLGVILTGAVLGSKRGSLAVIAYLAEGASGLPFFAAGTSGINHLIGFTGGYLLAFPIAAYITGFLCEHEFDRSFKTSIIAMLPGTLIIYLLGVSWLAYTLHLSPQTAISTGMLPFIPGDILKIIFATLLLPTAWKLTKNKK